MASSLGLPRPMQNHDGDIPAIPTDHDIAIASERKAGFATNAATAAVAGSTSARRSRRVRMLWRYTLLRPAALVERATATGPSTFQPHIKTVAAKVPIA